MTDVSTTVLDAELAWIDRLIEYRFNQTLTRLKNPDGLNETDQAGWPADCDAPHLPDSGNAYAELARALKLVTEERLLLALSLAVHIDPYFFTRRKMRFENLDIQDEQPDYGAGLLKGVRYDGLVPSGHTFLLLAAGNNPMRRLHATAWLLSERPLFKHKVLRLEPAQDNDPIYLGKLVLAHAYFELFTGLRTNDLIEK